MGTSIGQFLKDNAKVPTGPAPTDGAQSLMDGILSQGNAEESRLKASVEANPHPTNAERSQKILDIADRTGLDAGIVDRNLDSVETRIWRTNNVDAAKGPVLRGWLSENPHHLPAVQRDLTQLNYLERQVAAVKGQFVHGQATVRRRKLAEKDFKGTLSRSEEAELEALEKHMGEMPSMDEYGLDFGGALKGLPGGGLLGFLAQVPAYTANQVPIQANITAAGLKGAAAGAVGGAIAGAAGGPFAGITAAAGAGAGFFTGIATESAEMEGYLAYRDFKKLKDANGNPIPENIARAAAIATGITNGALEMLELGEVSKHIPYIRNFRRDAVKAALMRPSFRRAILDWTKASLYTSAWEGGTEWAQEIVPAAAGEIATAISDGSIKTMTAEDMFRRIFSSQHLAAAKQAGIAGAAGALGMTAVGGGLGLYAESRRAQAAGQAERFFQALGESTSQTEIAKTLPQKLQDIVGRMTKDGPLSHVYAPVETWNTYWQSRNIDPAEMASAVTGSTEAYNQAVAQGTDIQIPTDRYAATLAPTEHNEFFSSELRHAPDAMNGREMREAVKRAVEESKTPLTPEEATVRHDEVVNDLTDMLTATGIYTPEDAKTVSETLYGAHFKALAARKDVPLDVLKDIFRRTTISRAATIIAQKTRKLADVARTPAGARRKVHNVASEGLIDELDNIDARTEAATRRAIYRNVTIEGTSQAEVVVPMATKSAGGGPSMQAKALSLLVAYERIRNQIYDELKARGMTDEQINAERVARAENRKMVEAERDTQTETATEEADLPEWARELAGADISFNPAEFEQAQFVPGTPAFQEWFGDSKVLDEEGNPKVVYHGTENDFDTFDVPAFFGESPDDVEFYAGGKQGGTGRVVAAYLRIENPLDISTKKGAFQLIDIARSAGVDIQTGEGKYGWTFFSPTIAEHSQYDGTNLLDLLYIPAVRTALQQAGFDGIKAFDQLHNGEIPVWVAFDPRQIKSAAANTGKFSRSSNSIYEQPAYHGSPHEFDKFDLQKIGTGEGAQVYGWGLYFAGHKAVAEFYRDALATQPELAEWRVGSITLAKDGKYLNYSPSQSNLHPTVASFVEWLLWNEQHFREILDNAAGRNHPDWAVGGNDVKASILAALDDAISDAETEEDYDGKAALEKWREDAQKNGVEFKEAPRKGRIYEVEIPGDETMLDWDKPLSEQPKIVREALAKFLTEKAYTLNGERLSVAVKNDLLGIKLARELKKNGGDVQAALDKMDTLGGNSLWQAAVDAARKMDWSGLGVTEIEKEGTGAALYQDVADALGQTRITGEHGQDVIRSPEESASRYLAALGVNGIRYEADQIAQGGHEPSHNYVIFDDQLVQIKDFYQGQRTGDRLAVLHNIYPESLIYADKMGGLAVPSLGVVPEGMSYSSMGSVTLIGRQHLADPDEGVPVFDADVWSPTHPKPVYKKAPVKKRDALMKLLYPYSQPLSDAGTIYEIEQSLDRGDPATAIEKMLRSTAAMAAFLKEKYNVDATPEMRQKQPRLGFAIDTQAMRNFIEEGGNLEPGYDDKEGRQKLTNAFRAAVTEYVSRVHPEEDAATRKIVEDNIIKNWTDDDGQFGWAFESWLSDAKRDFGQETVDHWATFDKLEKMVPPVEFKRWVEEKVLPMHGEPLLQLGRKKVPYTLENVVAQMTRGPLAAAQQHMTFGEGKARAVMAQRISSIQEMRNRAAYAIAGEEEINAKREEATQLASDWRDAVREYWKYEDTWSALDSSMKAIARWGLTRLRYGDVAALARALRENDFVNVPIDVVRQGVEAGMAMLEAPVPYFEAKPQRAVALHEFAGAVMPAKAATPELLAVLEKNGITVKTYDDSGPDTMQEGKASTHQELRAQAVAELEKELADAGETVLFQSAYHGSPHRFEQFSLEKVGTGEGNTSYGWGLYFAGKRSVAEWYRENLSETGYEFDSLNAQENADIGEYWASAIARAASGLVSISVGSTLDNAITAMNASIAEDERLLTRNPMQPWIVEDRLAMHKRSLAALTKLRDSGVYTSRQPGRLYHVDLPDDATYLLWDKPLAEQPAPVQEAIRKAGYGDLIGTFKYPTIAQARRLLHGPTAERLAREDVGIRSSIQEGITYLSWWEAHEKDANDLSNIPDYTRERLGAMRRERADEARRQFYQWWVEHGRLFQSKLHDSPTGEHFYEIMMVERDIAEGRQARTLGERRKAASLFLREHGIFGIKYLDGNSRAKGEGTYNYVVFDDRQISVREYFQSPAPNDMDWSIIPGAPFKAYSALERAIAAAPFERGTPQQWRAALQKGVTQNERSVTGIDEFLNEKEKSNTKTLNRAQVLGYAQANRLQLGDDTRSNADIEEAKKAASDAADEQNAARLEAIKYLKSLGFGETYMVDAEGRHSRNVDNIVGIIVSNAQPNDRGTPLANVFDHVKDDARVKKIDLTNPAIVRLYDAAIKAQDTDEAYYSAVNDRVPYEEYTEPGGSNYRIIALTLGKPATVLKEGALPSGARVEEREPGDWVVYDANDGAIGAGDTREEAIADVALTLRTDADVARYAVINDGVFRSGHDMPDNTLVHIRLKDRIDKDSGVRFLFIEEIQSDWHQQGRKRGYEQALSKESNDEMDALVEQNSILFARWKKAVDDGLITAAEQLNDQRNRNSLRIQELRTKVTGIPDAPFKKTEEWVTLAFKRVLAEAVRGNYDAIAWTTGAQQNARYDLSTVAEVLEYQPSSNDLTVYGPGYLEEDEYADVRSFTVKPEDLPEYVGEDVARQLLAQPAQINRTSPDYPAYHHLVLDQPQTVGEGGMFAFYDRMLPKTLEKLLKKMGVEQKVSTTRLDFTDGSYSERDLREAAVQAGLGGDLGVEVPALWIEPQVREAVEKGVSLYQGADKSPRGRIRISSLGNISIEMLEKADLSTFIHETGHFYTEVLQRLAEHSPSVKADLDVLRRWVRAEDGKALTRDQNEQIARGFEAYIMEGKAPTTELQGAFSRMKAWMLLTYRNIKALKVNLTDDVRQVFDRLLATEDEIANAKEGLPALFPNASDFLSGDQLKDYEDAVRHAQETATLSLEQSLLADVKRAYTKAWKEARAKIRAEVADDINADPVWRALSILQRGTLPDGTELPEGMEPVKLDRQDIVDRYGERQLVLLPKPYIYATEGGITVDAAAELFGFPSGDAFIKALPQVGSETPRARVERITDERMKKEFGDKLLDGKAAEEAMAAVHNEDRARLLQLELKHLASQRIGALKGLLRAITRKVPVVEEVRAEAEHTIDAMRHRDIRPNLYLVAEKKAAKSALESLLKGDIQLAFDEKQRELLNHELYRAAVRAKTRAESTRKFLSKFTEKDTRARIGKAGGTYLEQIDALLERVDFAPKSLKALDRRESLREFADAHPQADIPEQLLSEAYSKNWQEMTVGELNDLRDTITQIAHLAKTKNTLLKNKKVRELSEAGTMFVGAVVAHSKGAAKQEIETRLPSVNRKRSIASWFAAHRKFANIVRVMDGFVEGGPIWSLVVRPLNEAASEEASEHLNAARWLQSVFAQFNDEKRTMYQKQEIQGTDLSLSKMGRLMVALNWGNEINRQRLMGGYGWSEKTVQAILDSLENSDWDFVEQVWSNINDYWPRLEALGQQLTGLKPEKVEPSPFTTRTGREIRGGYFPISFDDRQSQEAYEHDAEDIAARLKRGAAVRASTEKGMLKERVKGNVKQQVRLDFGVIFEHVSDVIHTITHTETLMDVSNILRHPPVMAAIKAHYGDLTFKEMTKLLDDVAAGDTPIQEGIEDKFAWLRTGAIIVGLGFNATTMLLQPFGLANSMARIGPRWVGRGVARWASNAARMEKTVEWIHNRSAFMRTRHSTMSPEVSAILQDIGFRPEGPVAAAIDAVLEKTVGDKLTRQGIRDSFLWGIGKMQMVADIPTWLGAYEKAFDEPGMEEDEAVARADQAVKDSQGAGQTMDLARVQRGNQFLKAWITFYSYFNVVYNQLADSAAQHFKPKNPVEIGRLAVDFMLVVSVPALLGLMLRDATGGGGDDDKKAPFWERLAMEHLSYLLGTMVFVREISSFTSGYFGYSGPAGGRIFGELGKFAAQAKQGELDEAFWKSLNRTSGILFHYPAVELERLITGIKALESDDTNNPMALIFGHKR